jgi:hypothetical protein
VICRDLLSVHIIRQVRRNGAAECFRLWAGADVNLFYGAAGVTV